MLAALMLALAPGVESQEPQSPPNILVLLIDDLGLEVLRAYDDENVFPPGVAERHPHVYPRTPAIDRLVASGVRFTQARVEPTCSSSRATLLTGRYPFRHGIGALIRRWDATPEYSKARTIEFGVGEGNREWTLAHLARAAGYTSLLCGKWHLALLEGNTGLGGEPGYGWEHVREVGGFDDYWAIWANLPGSPQPAPWTDPAGRTLPPGYYNFVVSENGEVENRAGEFVTTVQVDEVLRYVDAHREGPWLVVSPFNACHTPHQMPPRAMVQTREYVRRARAEARAMWENPQHRYSTWPFYMAMVEALDHEIGRLLDGLEERGVLEDTVVVLLADNGTPSFVLSHGIAREGLRLGARTRKLLEPGDERFKHTVWESGVRVPLIVSGPVVVDPGRSSGALVDATDLFETVRELMGVELSDVVPEDHAIDGVSLLPVLRGTLDDRDHARSASLVEHFEPTGNPERIEYSEGKMSHHYLRRIGFVLQVPEGTFKLVRNLDHLGDGRDRLFQLADAEGRPVDAFELSPLEIEDEEGPHHAVHERLTRELDALLRSEERNWRPDSPR